MKNYVKFKQNEAPRSLPYAHTNVPTVMPKTWTHFGNVLETVTFVYFYFTSFFGANDACVVCLISLNSIWQIINRINSFQTNIVRELFSLVNDTPPLFTVYTHIDGSHVGMCVFEIISFSFVMKPLNCARERQSHWLYSICY